MSPAHRRTLNADTFVPRIDEVRPMASAARLASALIVGLVLWTWNRSEPWVYVLVGVFGIASVVSLWRETTGRGNTTGLRYYCSTMAMFVLAQQGTADSTLMLTLCVQPLLMATLLHGIRTGLALSVCTFSGVMLDVGLPGFSPDNLVPALGLVCIAPIMSGVIRPVGALRQRMQLADDLERDLDPRRGLVAVGQETSRRLLAATDARRVVLCHRDAEVPTVLTCDEDDGAFVLSPALSARILNLIAELPTRPMALQAKPNTMTPLDSSDEGLDDPQDRPHCEQLAKLLEADYLQLVPDMPGRSRSGWLLVAYGAGTSRRRRPWPLQPLAAFASDIRRLLQQASYVDSLQSEIAAHERSRIGRDLHDSAIQPYLGLKFAIEALAMQCPANNPLHGPVQELRSVCESELLELRKTVSALRAGSTLGENSLTTALQRQCSRFARIFDIQVDLQVPADLQTNRTLASALLHMVNEALNNVRRHTQAHQVWITLTSSPGGLQLLIRDDAGRRSGKKVPDFEPRSLAERARELGGVLTLRRHGSLDTEIQITLPH